MTDLPFYEAAAAAYTLKEKGITIYQKFTCDGCGQRLTVDVPNQFFKYGTCDKCPVTTNIEAKGCGYMATGDMRLIEEILHKFAQRKTDGQ